MLQALLMILGFGKDLFVKRQEQKARELEAETNAKIRRMDNAKSWEQLAAAKSSRFLRWMLALHLMAGLDFTIYLSVTGAEDPGVLFAAMGNLPEWYAGLLATMFAWAFASEPLKAVGGKMAESWSKRKHKGSGANPPDTGARRKIKDKITSLPDGNN